MAAILHKKGQLHGSYNLGLSSMPVELYQRPFHFVSSPTGDEVIQVQIPPIPPKKSSQSNVINGVLPETDKQSYQQCLQATKRHSFSHFQLHWQNNKAASRKILDYCLLICMLCFSFPDCKTSRLWTFLPWVTGHGSDTGCCHGSCLATLTPMKTLEQICRVPTLIKARLI